LFDVHAPPGGNRPHDPFTQVAGAVHWAFVVHVLLHADVAVSQRPGAHPVIAGVTQVPVPLHVDGGVRVDAVEQLATMHWVPEAKRAHCPAAHCPVVPQVDCAWTAHSRCGSAPLLTLLQFPVVPARLQAWQAVLQALLQQTPCAQKLLAHSVAAEQTAPNAFNPQLLIIPFMPQMFGEMHCALVVHEPKHLLALQWYGLHAAAGGLMHWPDALQVDGPVYTSVTQVSGAQTVSIA
jgi:hypothetical protein